MVLKHFKLSLTGSERLRLRFFKFNGPVVRFHLEGIREGSLSTMTYSNCFVDIPLWGYDGVSSSTYNGIRFLLGKFGLLQIKEVVELLKFRREHAKWTRGGRIYKWLFDEPVYTGTLPLDYEPTGIEVEMAAAARKKSKWVKKDVCALWYKLYFDEIIHYNDELMSLESAKMELRRIEYSNAAQDAQWSMPWFQ